MLGIPALSKFSHDKRGCVASDAVDTSLHAVGWCDTHRGERCYLLLLHTNACEPNFLGHG
jgi:hypothetical protein